MVLLSSGGFVLNVSSCANGWRRIEFAIERIELQMQREEGESVTMRRRRSRPPSSRSKVEWAG